METADRKANGTTRGLLQALAGVKAGEGRVVSGVFSPEGVREVHEATGVWPCLLGTEYCTGWGLREVESPAKAVEWRERNPDLVEHWNAGGIVRVLTHFPNPTNPRLGGLRDKTADIGAVLRPGTPERDRWLGILDGVAEGFHDLDENGVSVIYGPLHEMNEVNAKDSFWWGALLPNVGVGGYKALWLDAFERITVHNGCHNVLWLWSPLGHCPFVADAYPGDDAVDLVGLDVYDGSLLPYTDNHKAAVGLGKPFMLGEYGPLIWNIPPDQQEPGDCLGLLSELRASWPDTCAFMYWGAEFLPTRQRNAVEAMNHTMMINRGGLR